MIQRILIRNARILKTRKASLTPSCDLLIEDNRIKTMLPSEAAQTLRQWFENLPADAAKQIEASQGVLMPGLIDCHVHVLASQMHLGQLGRLPNVLAVLRAVPILEGMIRRGFTTVRDAGGADDALRQATADGTILGPRIFPSGRALSQTGGHGDMRERNDVIEPCACTVKVGAIARIVDGVDAMRKAVREEIQRGATQIKIMA
ncbi:MAG: amidohydrolase family protein, partial [Betaproteobacteria bacterium]|nr:amidohydrolase family protein [Betaproteobacteria bacterium]